MIPALQRRTVFVSFTPIIRYRHHPVIMINGLVLWNQKHWSQLRYWLIIFRLYTSQLSSVYFRVFTIFKILCDRGGLHVFSSDACAFHYVKHIPWAHATLTPVLHPDCNLTFWTRAWTRSRSMFELQHLQGPKLFSNIYFFLIIRCLS